MLMEAIHQHSSMAGGAVETASVVKHGRVMGCRRTAKSKVSFRRTCGVHYAPLLPAICVALFSCLSAPSAATPMKPWDNFVSPCGDFLPDPPPSPGYKLWSSPSTWPNGVVPGVARAQNVNVTIPCGTAVLLDVALVRLTVLNVRGLLRVLDTPSLPSITIHAAFIIVEGQLHAGTPSQHFSQRLTFNLLPNPNKRAIFWYSANLPAEPAFPRNFGEKAFVVVGGQVRLHGMPGGSNTLPYTKLNAHALKGDVSFVVGGNVMSWPDKASVVVATTDYSVEQNEIMIIQRKELLPGGGATRIFVTKPFKFDHFGDPLGIPDGFGGFVDERAEVALLARNIVITGTDEPAPNNLFGGHFMIFHTATPQFIEGVNFWRLGQQGILGRYSIHFHLSGNQEGTLLRRNLILDSKQRCVVIHATFNLTVEENVSFNNFGHCFMVEEGGEINNKFIRNLGIRAKAVELLIPNPLGAPKESDDLPSLFWLSNPRNDLVGNIGVASDDSGFWFQLVLRVRGNTLLFPPWNSTVPNQVPPGLLKDNVAHSNLGPGIRYYPSGYSPRSYRSVDNNPYGLYLGSSTQYNEGTLVFKHQGHGIFLHNSERIVVTGATFADNRYGITFNGNEGLVVTDSRFIGLSTNYGNPGSCKLSNQCGPIAPSCTFPIPKGQKGRSQLGSSWQHPVFGVMLDQTMAEFDGYDAHRISNSRFSNYDPTCRPAAAIGVALSGGAQFYWNSAHSVSGIQLAPGSIPFYYPPPVFTFPDQSKFYGLEAATQYAFFDRDGSTVGGSSGYVVVNNLPILPPQSRQPCTFKPSWNAYACPNVCYRTLWLQFVEEGYADAEKGEEVTRPRSDGSYLIVRRLEDGQQFISEGDLRCVHTHLAPTRLFALNLVSGYTYEITIMPPARSPSFAPQNITVQYRDASACRGNVTLRFLPGAWHWSFPEQSNSLGWRPCPGAQSSTASQFSYVCHMGKSTPQILLGANFTSNTPITIFRAASPSLPCQSNFRCTVLPSNSFWAYNTSGAELHAFYPGGPAFSNPLFDDSTWPVARGPLGATSNRDPLRYSIVSVITRPTPQNGLTTFYFRSSFSLTNSRCVTGLFIDVIIDDGAIVYLNGIEILRFNMPDGNISTTTRPLSSAVIPSRLYTTFYFPVNSSFPSFFTEGTNYLTAESHVATGNTSVLFDLRAWVDINNSSCSGRFISAEVCDGIDNDGDGLVDINLVTRTPLQRPCSTSCGVGTETCIRGAFQGCTAPPSMPETCNGIDDDCDGLVDDGLGQLDCLSTSQVCFAKQCTLRSLMTTANDNLLLAGSTWRFLDASTPLPPFNWTSLEFDHSLWGSGPAPLGANNPGIQTAITVAVAAPSLRVAYYFRQILDLPNGDCLFGITVSHYAMDGLVVYINGVESYRFNMPSGPSFPNPTTPIFPTTLAVGSPFVGWRTGGQFTGGMLKRGRNVVAVEVHTNARNDGNLYFDLRIVGQRERSTCTVASS